MSSSNATVVVGGPGCGKTTYLLDKVEEGLLAGYLPEDIAFFSFTRKAAEEGRNRAAERFGIPPERFTNFKTFHAFSFRQLNARRDRMLGWQHLEELGKHLGLEFKGKSPVDEDSVYGMNSADRLVFLDGLAKNKQVPLKQVWEEAGEDSIGWFELLRFSETLERFKKSRGLVDFNDLLERTVLAGTRGLPKFKLMLVDETQDLSPLQWSLQELLADGAEQVYCGGDDRQNLYGWSGSDVGRFINLPGKQVTLQQSRRIPASVHRVAEEIASRLSHKRRQKFAPREEEGSVNWHNDVEDVDVSSGSWLLLARNGYMLERMEQYCLSQGFSFHSVNKDPLKSPSLVAIRHWEDLRKGKQVCAGQVLEVFKLMTRAQVSGELVKKLKGEEPMQPYDMGQLKDCGLLVDAIWHEALVRIPSSERDFFIAARKRGEALWKSPRITISTIHASKGGEADHVLLMTDISHRCFQNMESDPDAEHRVFYVGATRCRKTLNLINPRTDLFYDV